eukprot:10674-Eustigmatos_ZCMA.PRE.1
MSSCNGRSREAGASNLSASNSTEYSSSLEDCKGLCRGVEAAAAGGECVNGGKISKEFKASGSRGSTPIALLLV